MESKTLKLKFIGRDYQPLTHGEEYPFIKAEEGLFRGDVYICVDWKGRKVWAHYWRFEISYEDAKKLITP